MSDERQKSLIHMQVGQSGVIVEIQGGHTIIDRLSVLGIRPGQRVTKVGSMVMHGPVTLEVDRTQVAVGFGMASKIVVEPD